MGESIDVKELRMQREVQIELMKQLKQVDVESKAYDVIYAKLQYVNEIITNLRTKV